MEMFIINSVDPHGDWDPTLTMFNSRRAMLVELVEILKGLSPMDDIRLYAYQMDGTELRCCWSFSGSRAEAKHSIYWLKTDINEIDGVEDEVEEEE
jgi:hypothetical protein